MHYTVGTRGSKLAIIQTEYVINKLIEKYPEDTFELKVIKTTGDKNLSQALDKIGSKGIFTDEIEAELLSGEIDLAVHSMKDMPDTVAEGLTFSKAWKREDPRDVLVLRNAKGIDELPEGAVIGTGSKRRAFQIKKLRPDLKVVGIRGNVDTRIKKLMDPEQGLDGIVLAAAGLIRLGREAEITQYLEPEQMIPAPAQGTLAIEVKADNLDLLNKINALSDQETELAVTLERGFLKAIDGDCHLPIGAYYSSDKRLMALFGNEEGTKLAMTTMAADITDAGQIPNIIAQVVESIRIQLEEQ